MPDWRIYYADGSIFEGDPYDAPGDGVACIVVCHPDVGRKILNGADFYVWDRGQWFDSDLYGALRRLIDHPRTSRMVAGIYMHDDAWKAIYEIAVNDPDFPVKSGYAPDERKG